MPDTATPMSIQFNLNSLRGDYEIDLTQWPAVIENKGSKFMGLFFMAFAGVWGGVPGYLLFRAAMEQKSEPGLYFMIVFPVIGAGLFYYGFSQFFLRERWEVFPDSVQYTRQGLSGHGEWFEPITNYRGILQTTERRSTGGKNSTTYTVYCVYLHHPERRKSIRLYESRNGAQLRAKWEYYSRAFGLPAIERSGKDYIHRDADDLDKTVKQRVAEGDISIHFNPAGPAPKGLTAVYADSTFTITQQAKQKGLFVALPVVLGLTGLFIYIGFFGNASPVFGYFGVFFLAVFMFCIVYDLITTPRYIVRPDRIKIHRLTPLGETKGVTIQADAIESIEVKRNPSTNQPAVVIDTDRQTEAIGNGLNEEARRWLRDCMVYTVSKN